MEKEKTFRCEYCDKEYLWEKLENHRKNCSCKIKDPKKKFEKIIKMVNKNSSCLYFGLLVTIPLAGSYIYCSYPGKYCVGYQDYLSGNPDVIQQGHLVSSQRDYIMDGITSTASATPVAIPIEISNIF